MSAVGGGGDGGERPIWDRLLVALPYTVYVYDRLERRVELANRNVIADLGYTPEQVAGFGDAGIKAIMHPDDRPRFPELLARWEQAADGEVLESEYRLRHADGTWRWFMGRDTVLDRDPDGRVRRLVGTIQDITQRVELEHSLARSQTLEAVGRLAGGVAHDFNNLLTAIMANVAMAQRSIATGRPASTTLDHIEQIGLVADDAARLTRQLLTFARQQSTRPEIVDPNAVLLELRPTLRRLIEEHVELDWQLDPDAPRISIERSSFTQVILNLAINARDAMPSGGRLTVRTAARDGGLLLTVEDTGTGMSSEVAQRIFDPFYTTKPVGGTGLGLSTVYGILRGCGATIVVDSEPGRGSRFVVAFPRPSGLAPSHARARRGRRGAEARSGNLLLVEDNPALAEATAAFLEDCGYRVRVAPDGETGLEIFTAMQAELDVVITDVVMPRLSGIELARRVLAAKPGLKVLLWSGYPSSASASSIEALAGAGFRFTAKPLLPEELLDAVDDLLAEGSAARPPRAAPSSDHPV